MDEDGGDAKESEVARDRQGRVAVYLHRGRLQPLSIAKPNGLEHDTQLRFEPRSVDRTTQSTPSQLSDNQNSRTESLKNSILQQAAKRLAGDIRLVRYPICQLPGYNRDRGPIIVPGLRLHLEL